MLNVILAPITRRFVHGLYLMFKCEHTSSRSGFRLSSVNHYLFYNSMMASMTYPTSPKTSEKENSEVHLRVHAIDARSSWILTLTNASNILVFHSYMLLTCRQHYDHNNAEWSASSVERPFYKIVCHLILAKQGPCDLCGMGYMYLPS